MFLYYVDRPLFWFFVLFSNSEIACFSVLVPCRHEVLWYARFRNSAKTTFNLDTRALDLHFSGAVRTLPFPHSGENAAKNRASVLVRPQGLGATRRKRAGCATHFGIRSPDGTALLFLVCAFIFLPPAAGAFFFLSLEAPSLAAWLARSGEKLRSLARSSRPFGRSPSWKFCPAR